MSNLTLVQALRVQLSEAQIDARNARSIAEINRAALETAHRALEQIFAAMDGKEWDSGTTSEISAILTAAGYTVREPLLASDFGERGED